MTSNLNPSNANYIDPDIGWENANSNASMAPEQDAEALDSAFQQEKQESKDVSTPTSDSTPSSSAAPDQNPVDRQLGIISRMSG